MKIAHSEHIPLALLFAGRMRNYALDQQLIIKVTPGNGQVVYDVLL